MKSRDVMDVTERMLNEERERLRKEADRLADAERLAMDLVMVLFSSGRSGALPEELVAAATAFAADYWSAHNHYELNRLLRDDSAAQRLFQLRMRLGGLYR